jgi:Leucine-rich repeat (LRR) protein
MTTRFLQQFFRPSDEWNPDPKVTYLVFHSGWTVLPELSGLVHLRSLNCYKNNHLSKLPDLSALRDLRKIYCHSNQLAELPDLTGLDKLEEIWCYNNKLTRIPDLTELPKLVVLYCPENPLEREFEWPQSMTSKIRIEKIRGAYRVSSKQVSGPRIRNRLALLLTIDLLFDPLSDLTDAL